MRLTFHIGAGKTGTSAIQHALATNTAQLARQGVYVPPQSMKPGENVTGYQVFRFEAIKQMPPAEATEQFASDLDAVVSAAASQGNTHIVFSAENLSNPYPWADVLSATLADFEVDIVMYVRRQDDFLLSAWQQWGLKGGTTFDEWLLQNLDTMGDWRVPIEEWQKLCSPGSFRIRIYERPRLVDGDVVADFFATVGIDTSNFTLARQAVNQSYSMALEELAMSSGKLFDGAHDNGFFNFADRVGVAAHHKVPGQSRLTHRERRLILNRYRESNAWIRDHFPFHENTPAELFRAPQPDEFEIPTETELIKNQLGLLAELIYGEHLDRTRQS